MQGYIFISPDHALRIRRERVSELETEHFHAMLLLEENPKDMTAQNAAAELERRIDHHIRALTGDAENRQDEVHPEPENEVTSGVPS